MRIGFSFCVIPTVTGRRLALLCRGTRILRTWNVPGWVPLCRFG